MTRVRASKFAKLNFTTFSIMFTEISCTLFPSYCFHIICTWATKKNNLLIFPDIYVYIFTGCLIGFDRDPYNSYWFVRIPIQPG